MPIRCTVSCRTRTPYQTLEPRRADPILSGRVNDGFGLVRKILRKCPCLGIRYQSVVHATITIEALNAQFSTLARPLWSLKSRNRQLERFNVQERTD